MAFQIQILATAPKGYRWKLLENNRQVKSGIAPDGETARRAAQNAQAEIEARRAKAKSKS